MINFDENLQKIKTEGTKVSKEIKERTMNFILTAFGLVAGLAWNEAIQALIRHYFPLDKNSVLAKFIYAFLLTLILVLITIYLTKVFNKKDKAEGK